jgi:microcin C transport system substrate-binding protein
MIGGGIAQSNSPGNELRDYFGSVEVKAKGTRNYAGIEDPTIDALIEQVVAAADFEQLKTTMRLLDRVLLNGYYMVPMWHQNKVNLAYWNKFARPKISPIYNPIAFDTWWMKEAAAEVTESATPQESTQNQASSLYDTFKAWFKGLFSKTS